MNVSDGKYVGELTPEEVIEQFEYRTGIHLSYIELNKTNSAYEAYGTTEYHLWAINGYEHAIKYLRGGKEPMQSKKWYTSKTVWINLLMAVGIVLNVTVGNDLFNAETQGAIVIVVNLILRLITGKPLSK